MRFPRIHVQILNSLFSDSRPKSFFLPNGFDKNLKRYIVCWHPPKLFRSGKKSRCNLTKYPGFFSPSNNIQIPVKIEVQKAEIRPPSKMRKESIRLKYSVSSSMKIKNREAIPEHDIYQRKQMYLPFVTRSFQQFNRIFPQQCLL